MARVPYPYELQIQPCGRGVTFRLMRQDAAGNWLDWEVQYAAGVYADGTLAPHWEIVLTTSGSIY